MRREIKELAMQPGEPSRAAERCGDSPSVLDSETAHPAVRTVEQMFRTGAVLVSYAGCETSILERPIKPSVLVLYSKRSRLPA